MAYKSLQVQLQIYFLSLCIFWLFLFTLRLLYPQALFFNPQIHQRALEKCYSFFLRNNTIFEFLFFICLTLIMLQISTITTSGKPSLTLWTQFLFKHTQNCTPFLQSTFYRNDILHRVNIMIIGWTSDIYTISSQIRTPRSGFAYQIYLSLASCRNLVDKGHPINVCWKKNGCMSTLYHKCWLYL